MDKRDKELLAKQMRMLDDRSEGVALWTVLAATFVFLAIIGFLYTQRSDRFQVASNDLPSVGTPRPAPSMLQ